MEDADSSWWDKAAHPEYSFILSGAHRRRLTPMGAPALTRHLAFWNATPQELPDAAPWEKGVPDTDPRGNDPKQVKLRALAADICIAALYRRLIELEATTVSGLTVPETVDGNLVVLFAGVIDKATGQPLKGEPVAHILTDSYRAIKFNFRWHGIETKLSFELHSEYVTMTSVLDLSGGVQRKKGEKESPTFTDICKTLRELCEADEATVESEAATWRERLYDWVWAEFSQDMLQCLRPNISLLGRMFLDFRGLIVRPRPRSRGLRRFMPPYTMTRRTGGPIKNPATSCRPEHLQRIWPLIHAFGTRSADQDSSCPEPADGTEYAVSLFLDGRAVYASALGNQASLLTSEPPRPLYYFLYEDTLFPWQLGRLVYRIHRAGTARLAAIMHFGKLRDAHQILGEIETRLEQDIVRPFGTKDVVKLQRDLRELNNEVERRLADISGLGLETSLETRVERSRYYVDQFKATVKALRVGRVEGYQTYDEFVRQRLMPMFDYIDRLGKKFARIQEDRLLLIGRIQSLDSQYETTLISNAQRLADFALSCVLGPYYVAYTLSHGLSGLVPARGIWLGAVILGPVMLVVLFLKEAIDRRDKRARRPETKSWKTELRRQALRKLTLFITFGTVSFALGILLNSHLDRRGVHSETPAVNVRMIERPRQAEPPRAAPAPPRAPVGGPRERPVAPPPAR